MKHTFLILSFLLILFSCGKNESVVVDSSSLLPQSQSNYLYEEDTIHKEVHSLDEFQKTLTTTFPHIQFNNRNILTDDKAIFLPNRLGYTNKKEYYFTLDTIAFHFLQWDYTDSAKSMNAFFNWLDCFNTDCRSIRILERVNGSKNSFLLAQSNQSIYFLESNNIVDRNSWEKAVFQHDSLPFNYLISQSIRGKMKWIIPTR